MVSNVMEDQTYAWCASLPSVATPTFIIDENRLQKNLQTLNEIQKATGAKILLAQKAFSGWKTYPLISQTLAGTCASSPHEAQLGFEEFGKEVHTFAAAYSEKDVHTILNFSDHIVFNSFHQWERFKPLVQSKGGVSCGIRVNPHQSEISTPLYDPCALNSRLGVTKEEFRADLLDGIEGLHFHALCQNNSYALERTLHSFEQLYGHLIPRLRWVNFGGGHHITRNDYDVPHLISLIQAFQGRHPHVQIYLEPGEAVALEAGILVASVLDIVKNGMEIAILDTSATCHMPDVIEMPYRPHIITSGEPNEKPHTYRLAGLTCLAGDIIGDYSFEAPLAVGDQLIFTDMAIYSMVKTTTFNGIQLPSIMTHANGELSLLKEFTYEDFKNRLS